MNDHYVGNCSGSCIGRAEDVPAVAACGAVAMSRMTQLNMTHVASGWRVLSEDQAGGSVHWKKAEGVLILTVFAGAKDDRNAVAYKEKYKVCIGVQQIPVWLTCRSSLVQRSGCNVPADHGIV